MSEKLRDYIFKIWIVLSSIIVLTVVVFILGYIFKNGFKSMNMEFIFADPKGMPIGSEGGVFPAIVGSLYLMAIACVFASILAISTAIYTVFYCKSKKLESIIHLIDRKSTRLNSSH